MMFIEGENIILVADQDSSVMQAMQELCREEAILAYFQDGKEVAQFLKEHRPKLVVLSDDLPHVSGKQLINGMRYTRHLKDIPALLVSQNSLRPFKDATKVLSSASAEQLRPFVHSVLSSSPTVVERPIATEKKAKHIFLVEDSQTVSTLLQHLFSKEGFMVTKADNVEIAKKIILKQLDLFDLAILDVNLPGGTGFDLLELIRTKSQLPTVILSSIQSSDNIDRSFALGAQDFIPKPFNPRDLLKRLRPYLS